MVPDIVQVVKVVSLEPMKVDLHSQTLEVVEEMVVSPELDPQVKEQVSEMIGYGVNNTGGGGGGGGEIGASGGSGLVIIAYPK